jgi:RHS repeat-associated protein
VVNLNYDYDGLANVTKITNTLDTTDTQTLTYDGLDRLLTAGTSSLTYDPVGNLQTYTTNAGTLTYSYTDNRLAAVTGRLGRSYLYDAYGHTVSDGTRTLRFDDAGNLRAAGLYGYDYDGRNQRVRTRAPGGIETTFFTGHQGLLLGEYAPDGSFTREYAYLGTRLLALIDRDPLGNERTTTLHPNALGSPVAATDEQGNLLWKETYQPYGERKQKSPNSTNNNRWYTGHPEDPETGLVYAGARYYDPVIGRFLSTDPVSLTEKNPHSFNRYGYANNNPYKYIDPDGRDVVIAIQRDTYTPLSVGGTISVTSDRVRDSFSGFVLESARAGDNLDKSPISPGTYGSFIRTDHSPNRVELRGGEGYENIQIHKGNEPFEVKGCFAVGNERSEDRVSNSADSLAKILGVIEADQRYTFGQGKITTHVDGPSTDPLLFIRQLGLGM